MGELVTARERSGSTPRRSILPSYENIPHDEFPERELSKTIEIKVPDIGDFSDVPVIEVLVKEGDRVQAEDGLITLESDKATMEVPAPAAGTIRELRLKLDDKVSQGDVVAILEVEEEGARDTSAEAPGQTQDAAADRSTDRTADQAQESEQESEQDRESGQSEDGASAGPEGGESDGGAAEREPESTAGSDRGRAEAESGHSAEDDEALGGERLSGPAAIDPSNVPYASPAVRKFARELGVDLSRVDGSGDRGRILREDVFGFVKSAMSEGGTGPAAPAIGGLRLDFPERPELDFSRYGEIERTALTRIQKISAGHLHRNWIGIPHVTQHDEADITDMEAFRLANAEEAQAQGFKLTPLVFLIKAMVASLKKFPRFNASLDPDGETLILKKYYNIGIAVDTPDGLMVPVLRNCERKGIMELAAELAEVSARARDKKLSPQDIQGGCISISSLGGIGGTAFTPIINAPEVAILGVSRSRMQPVWDGSEFRPRLMLPLSLSYDHRVIDGAAAARFTRFLASRLEDLRRLTL
jgi:pyruvate dehydrogenase E2 component (dihydrolipoamide acetyltransferase)